MIVEVFYDLEKSLSSFKHEKIYDVFSVKDFGDELLFVREKSSIYPNFVLKKDHIKRLRIL